MIVTNINIKGKEVDVDIYLRGSVVVIRGDYTTKKSLLMNIIKKEVIQMKASGIESNVEIFDYMRANMVELKLCRNKLIIIDNADELIKNNNKIINYINNDCSNQYIIIGRSVSKLHIMPNYIGHLEVKNIQGKKVITLEYDYTNHSWW